MTTYLFSQLAPGQTLTFDPDQDVLSFDSAAITPCEMDFYPTDATGASPSMANTCASKAMRTAKP